MPEGPSAPAGSRVETGDAVQADLRFLFDAPAGGRALIVGDWPVLVEALRRQRVDCVENVAGLEADPVDLLLVPRAETRDLSDILSTASERLRAGGTLVVGFRNACSLQRLRFWKKRLGAGHAQTEATWSLASTTGQLEKAGFAIASRYGIHERIERPRHIVPLDDPRLSRWLFGCRMVPESHATRLALSVAPIFCSLGLPHWLYSDILVVARKYGEGGGE